MRRILSIIVILFLPYPLFSQQGKEIDVLNEINNSTFEIGLKSGVTATTFQINPLPNAIRLKSGAGITNHLLLKFGSNTGTAFKAEPGYLQKRSKIVIPGDSVFTFTYNMEYVSLPFYATYQNKFNYLFGRVFQQFYVSGGVSFNFLFDANRKIENDRLNFSQINPIEENVTNMETSVIFALGSRFVIGSTSSLYLEVKGENGLTNINETLQLFLTGPSSSGFEINQFGFSLMLGFSASIPGSSNEDGLR